VGRVANARGPVVAAISLLGVVGACFYAEPRERSVDGGGPPVDGAPAATPTDADSPSDAGVPTCPDEAGCTLPRVVQIAAGGSHTCARLADGSLRCWGANSRGELGNGTTTDRLRPTPVVGVSAATDVAVGGGHSCAITRDGAAYCWGANGAGSVGDGTFDDRATPQRVRELPPVVKLACGGHSCARAASGAVFCWGINQNGQLGDGTRGARAVATPVLAPAGADGDAGARALTGITSLSVGGTHMCALDGAGHALCWGSSSLIGVASGGRETNRPIQLEWTGFLSLSAGAEHTCARMADRAARNAGTPYDPDKEFFGQGLILAFVPLLSGMPLSGALARTSTKIQVGGVTPLAELSKSILKLLLVFFLSRYLEMVPMACIGGLLLWVAFGMVKPAEMKEIWTQSAVHRFLMIYTAVTVVVLGFLPGVISAMVIYGVLVRALPQKERVEAIAAEAEDEPVGHALPDSSPAE